MIYDCFTFFNELDILDIRLHEMSPVVDKFVLVEATKTHQGKPKPLYYAQNRDRFAAFRHKIIHVVVEFPEELSWMVSRKCPTVVWARENFQRNQITRGLTAARRRDLVIVSDVDEIIAADRLRDAVATRRRGDLTVFTMPLYGFFINRRVRGAIWTFGPRMIEFGRLTTPQKLRNCKFRFDRKARGGALSRLYMRARNVPRHIRTRVVNRVNCGIGGRVVEAPDAGWHLSSIGNWDTVRVKARAVAHDDWQKTHMFNNEQAYIAEVLQTTEEVHDFGELPSFVQANLAKFTMLHDRQAAAE